MRILTDIPDDDLEKLDALAAKEKRSRAATIRDAVKLYLVQKSDNQDWIERGYGYWADRDDIPDGVGISAGMREDRRPTRTSDHCPSVLFDTKHRSSIGSCGALKRRLSCRAITVTASAASLV
jgi:hypothetical protein